MYSNTIHNTNPQQKKRERESTENVHSFFASYGVGKLVRVRTQSRDKVLAEQA